MHKIVILLKMVELLSVFMLYNLTGMDEMEKVKEYDIKVFVCCNYA